MSYVTPIYDRSVSDIAARNSKAYFNVADWTRVYGNAQYINAEILSNTGATVAFSTVSTPTTSTDPTTIAAALNTLLADIEAMRVYVVALGASISAIATLVYTAGAGTYAPKYTDVNQWEYCIDQIKLFLDPLSLLDVVCGVATTGGDYVLDSI